MPDQMALRMTVQQQQGRPCPALDSMNIDVAGRDQRDLCTGGGRHECSTGARQIAGDIAHQLRHAATIQARMVAEGRLGKDGVFHAQTLLAKCPSRFSTKPYTQ